MTAQAIEVGDVPVRALRVTYVGELGWELYCPAEFGAALWRTLWEAGEGHDLVAGGYRAIDSLRLEKGYRVWGADITPDEHPFQAGLGFAVKLDQGEFIGREALLRARADGAAPQLCCLVLEDPRSVALSNEPVRVDGQVLGRVTSGGYGYTVGASIAYAYLPAEHAEPGTEVAVEIFGEWVRGAWRASRSTTPTASASGPRRCAAGSAGRPSRCRRGRGRTRTSPTACRRCRSPRRRARQVGVRRLDVVDDELQRLAASRARHR